MGSIVSCRTLAFISSRIPDIILNMMGSLPRHAVEIEIYNKTRNITLMNPRIHFNCGRCSDPPKPELSPGCNGTCHFPGRYWLWGVVGILVYEAESFTLAIYFSNSFSMELGLELSPGKAHLDRLVDTYTRMAHGTYSSSHLDLKFNRGVMVEQSHETVQLSHGPVRVSAAMSSVTESCLRVVLEEQRGLGKNARIGKPRRRRDYQEK